MIGKPKTTYQQAVDEAADNLAPGLEQWVKRKRMIQVMEVAYYEAETFVAEPEMRVAWTGNGVENLIAKAKTDPISFDALIHIAVNLINAGRAIPEPLSHFATEVLRGRQSRPNKSSRYAKANEWRDMMISLAVLHIERFGLPATHNDATPGGLSACAAVAEAIERLTGKSFKYRTVKDIWQNFKRPTDPLDAAILSEIAEIMDRKKKGQIDHHQASKQTGKVIRRERP